MNDTVPSFFKDIGDSIHLTLDREHLAASLILTYSAINCMASLIMPENKKNVTSDDFKKWVDKYMKTAQGQSYQYQGEDLWGARCGLVHRYSPFSDLSEKGKCKVFSYHNGSEHIYNPLIHENVVMISARRLINDFYEGMKAFLTDLIGDNKLRKLAEGRIGKLFQVAACNEVDVKP